MLNNKWFVSEIHRQCHRITFPDIKAGWEQRVLLMSDEHVDNKECQRPLLKRHHEEAMACGAPIFKFGDTFCAMQGKWDRRKDQNQLREEHRGNNYLDLLVSTTADLYAPYAQNCVLWTQGNHESSIVNHHETDLLARLVERMKAQSKDKLPNMFLGGFWGFVKFQFNINGKTLEKTLCYHHGYGGGGEVTRGLIDNSRTARQYDADIFYSGHIHRRNVDENIITSCGPQGNIVKRQQLFLRGSTYKDETTGWHAEKGRAARPLGGWWLTFRYQRGEEQRHQIDMQYNPAT